MSIGTMMFGSAVDRAMAGLTGGDGGGDRQSVSTGGRPSTSPAESSSSRVRPANELPLNPLERPKTRGTRKSRFSIDKKRLARYVDAGAAAFAATREANSKLRLAYEARSKFERDRLIARKYTMQPSLDDGDLAKLAEFDAQIEEMKSIAARCAEASDIHGRISEIVREYAEACA